MELRLITRAHLRLAQELRPPAARARFGPSESSAVSSLYEYLTDSMSAHPYLNGGFRSPSAAGVTKHSFAVLRVSAHQIRLLPSLLSIAASRISCLHSTLRRAQGQDSGTTEMFPKPLSPIEPAAMPSCNCRRMGAPGSGRRATLRVGAARASTRSDLSARYCLSKIIEALVPCTGSSSTTVMDLPSADTVLRTMSYTFPSRSSRSSICRSLIFLIVTRV